MTNEDFNENYKKHTLRLFWPTLATVCTIESMAWSAQALAKVSFCIRERKASWTYLASLRNTSMNAVKQIMIQDSGNSGNRCVKHWKLLHSIILCACWYIRSCTSIATLAICMDEWPAIMKVWMYSQPGMPCRKSNAVLLNPKTL